MLNEDMEVIYDDKRWQILRRLRIKAVSIVSALSERNISAGVHGSIARGDVSPRSDVDVIILDVVPSHQVELALMLAEFKFYKRKIAQATPVHTLKAHIYLDPEERICVTFPLTPMRPMEVEFYKFGGYLTAQDLIEDKRVPGCNKSLMLIQPTHRGHFEFPVRGREVEVSKIVGVSLEIVQERVRVLTRRREVGRTGIVLSVDVGREEVFEDVLRRLATINPIVSRRLREE
jgi:predicted nucleotidyltransferase